MKKLILTGLVTTLLLGSGVAFAQDTTSTTTDVSKAQTGQISFYGTVNAMTCPIELSITNANGGNGSANENALGGGQIGMAKFGDNIDATNFDTKKVTIKLTPKCADKDHIEYANIAWANMTNRGLAVKSTNGDKSNLIIQLSNNGQKVLSANNQKVLGSGPYVYHANLQTEDGKSPTIGGFSAQTKYTVTYN